MPEPWPKRKALSPPRSSSFGARIAARTATAGPRAGEAEATTGEARPDNRQRFGRGGGQGRNEPNGGEGRGQRFGGKGGGERREGGREQGRGGEGSREERFGGGHRGGGKPHAKPERDAQRTMSTEPRRNDRQKPVDPDSPFAKLAALKDKLK